MRYWFGDMAITGAVLADVIVPGLENRRLEYARLHPGDPNTIAFAAGTRGRAKGIILDLKDVSTDAAIAIDLKTTTALPGTTKIMMLPTPPDQLTLRLSEAEDGRLIHPMEAGRYQDTVTLRFIDPNAPMDRRFDCVDTEELNDSDYYYVQVQQLDGEMAWSSPIWAGGEPPI